MVVFIKMKRTMFMMLIGSEMRNVKVLKSIKRGFPFLNLLWFNFFSLKSFQNIYVRCENVLGAIENSRNLENNLSFRFKASGEKLAPFHMKVIHNALISFEPTAPTLFFVALTSETDFFLHSIQREIIFALYDLMDTPKQSWI